MWKRTLLLALLTMSHTAYAGLQEAINALKGKRYQTAFIEFRALAEKGNADAQYYLGIMYWRSYQYDFLSNKSGSDNYRVGLQWFEKAAEKGHRKARTLVATAYASDGGTRNVVKAHYWNTKLATENDDVDAMTALGINYRYGDRGVVVNYAKAYEWWRKAADRGSKFAKKELEQTTYIDGLSGDEVTTDVLLYTLCYIQYHKNDESHKNEELRTRTEKDKDCIPNPGDDGDVIKKSSDDTENSKEDHKPQDLF